MSVPVPPRYSYPEDEKKYDWLPRLLDGYNLIDRAVAVGIADEQAKRRQNVGCHEGCFNCCLRPTVPILPVEFAAISWYACEKLAGEVREQVKHQLQNHLETTQCPFLVEGRCSIYPVRPVVCRTFHVFGDVCNEHEDPMETRRQDLWCPNKNIGEKFLMMAALPFDEITSPRKMKEAIASGYAERKKRLMHEMNWAEFGKRMLQFEK